MIESVPMAWRIARWGFGVTNAVLFLGAALPVVWLPLLAGGLSLIFLLSLVLLYNKALAAWRAVLIAWAAYIGLRLLAAALAESAAPFLRLNLGTLALVMAMDAMLVALAALVALAVRRDVSVVYVALGYALGAFVLLQMVRSTGGVLNFLTASSAPTLAGGAVLIGPLTLSLSCMVTLGFLSFFPHLLWMAYREIRGE